MRIPLMKPDLSPGDADLIRATIESGWITQGPRVAEFERNFAVYAGAPAAVAVSSATAALHLALHVAGVGAGDEVICPSMSFIATANSVTYTGATPVFADIDPETWNLDPRDAERRISPRTKAILLAHQIGLPADLDVFTKLAESHGLALIEDAACATGSTYRGEKIGARSQLACFSFHPRKVITTGDGGMITCRDPGQAKRLRALRQHGMSVSDQARHDSLTVMEEEYTEIGFNYRLTDLQACLGIKQLEKIGAILERRRQIAHIYNEAFARVPGLVLLREPGHVRWNYQSYPIRLPRIGKAGRDQLMQHLLDLGVSTRRGIMTAHRERAYSARVGALSLPASEQVSDCSVLLPLYGAMTEAEISFVIESVTRACRALP